MIRCMLCNEPMVCYDDINTCTVRVDFVRCTLCNSKAIVTYGDRGGHVAKVEWVRGFKEIRI